MGWQDMRATLSGQMIDKGLSSLARLALLHPRARPSRYGVDVIRELPFTNGLKLDVYKPDGADGTAIPVLYLHGGGFRILSKDTHWAMGLLFAGRSAKPGEAGPRYVVFNANYRLAPKHPFPAGCEDASAALLWVLEHAREYGADPDKLVLAGESAGGNLVTGLTIARSWKRPEPWARAVFDANPNIRALLPACGMLQVSDPPHRGTKDGFVLDRMKAIAAEYLPGGAKRDGTTDLADVVTFLEHAPEPERALPPVFAVCGGRDPVRLDTERLEKAWPRLGGKVRAKYYGEGIHTFHAFVWHPLAQEAWRDQHEFLAGLFA